MVSKGFSKIIFYAVCAGSPRGVRTLGWMAGGVGLPAFAAHYNAPQDIAGKVRQIHSKVGPRGVFFDLRTCPLNDLPDHCRLLDKQKVT